MTTLNNTQSPILFNIEIHRLNRLQDLIIIDKLFNVYLDRYGNRCHSRIGRLIAERILQVEVEVKAVLGMLFRKLVFVSALLANRMAIGKMQDWL
ncbi:hypothetical protein [Dyadobacter bucti]|uniref:hypothetical protein n=1 Tax=Dyadobacter bucti TaxID=2572203 RepID=UPI003F6FA727